MKEVIKADLSSQRDAEAIVVLLNEYAEDEMGGGQSLSDFARSNLINELSKRPNCAVFLAYVDSVPAGLAICFEVFSTFKCRPILNIHDVVVSEKFRGQGLSRDLFEMVEDFAVKSGCCKLTLEVLEGNKLAQDVYHKLGFSGYELDPKLGKAMFYEKMLPEV